VYVNSHIVKIAIIKRSLSGKFDNSNLNGRQDESSLEAKMPKATFALAQRLGAAHSNGLENLPMYAAGIAVAIASKVPLPQLDVVCGVYLASRVAFNVLYAMPPFANGAFRSLSWAVSVGATIKLYFLAAAQF
jgi:uncharacterized MAPEG superfamily protein